MNKRNLIIASVSVAVLVVGYLIFGGSESEETAVILGTVERGEFRVEIETTGELEAKNSISIMGPSGLRQFRQNSLTIQDIVPEGTRVSKGEWVASLDKSSFQTAIDDKALEVETEQSAYVTMQMDTTLAMKELRNQLLNLKFAIEEQNIKLEQSKFEPPATVRQVEIEVNKAERSYEQALESFKLKERQNIEKMREQSLNLREERMEYTQMQDMINEFTVLAPQDGMVIYAKGFDGKPIKAGSNVNGFNPTVAILPDLSVMLSKTYVNEVDVRKVQVGQRVEIGLDAYPDKRLAGSVVSVANVGEQLSNSDAKVFQVNVQIRGTDETLRPAMTTSNKIIASVVEDALFIPLEGLYSYTDSITFVYKKEGISTRKQEVMIGETNANNAVVLGGLSEGDVIYLSQPSGFDAMEVDLLPEMNGKRQQKQPELGDFPEITVDDAVLGQQGRGERGGGGEFQRGNGQGGRGQGEGQ